MLEAIEKIERYTSGLTFAEFETNDMAADAVVRNLEIIGEAARHIPSDWRAHHAGVDWRRVIGFRNIVIHEYFAVDLEIVWTIVTRQLEPLKKELKATLDGWGYGGIEVNKPRVACLRSVSSALRRPFGHGATHLALSSPVSVKGRRAPRLP